ncbi:MAG: polysaccharide biosynthesis C-terminal domain-containing protein [Eubacteriales bacterium]
MQTTKKTSRKQKSRKFEGFFGGVLILSFSTLICKVIGLFFKIPIINIVGIDGMAYFSSAYNIYMLLNSISVAGLPVAMSIMISRNHTVGNAANVKKIYNISLSVFLLLGIAGTMAMIFGAELYSSIIGIDGAAPAVRAIAPTLLFICISGAARGYFQGHEFMLPTAVSQIIESAGKLVLGVGFAVIAVNLELNDEYTAAAAVFGLSVGVFISMLYLTIRRIIFKGKNRINVSAETDCTQSSGTILRELCVIALPITLASCITSLTSLADTALITNRLVYGGYSKDAAVTLYSSYTNLAIPLFNLPPALITAVAVPLVPSLTSAITRKENKAADDVFSSSVRLCAGFSLPAAAGIALFALPILSMIYPSEAEACSFAAPLLSVLAPAIVFSCITTVFNAVLQAYLKPAMPIVSMAAGAVVKIITEYLLVGSNVGIYGAPISTVACTFTILLINMVFVVVYTPHRIRYSDILRPLVAAFVSIGLSGRIYVALGRTSIRASFRIISVIVLGVILYAILALLFGVVRYSDFARLPAGEKVAKTLGRLKLIKE